VLIPILFGLSSAVLAMVGINVGAGDGERARHIAVVSALVGLGITETIGLAAALFPMLWLTLFTHDPDVLAPGATYLTIVGPLYGLYGLGFVSSFAGQGAGRVLWPTIAVTVRLIVSAGGSWIAVSTFGGSFTTLAIIVAVSFITYGASAAMILAGPWPSKKLA